MTIDKQRKEILDRINYMYFRTDGTHQFPSSYEGDLLAMVYKYLKDERIEGVTDTKYLIARG